MAFYDNLFLQAMLDKVKAEKIEARRLCQSFRKNLKWVQLNLIKKSDTTFKKSLQDDPANMLKEQVFGFFKTKVNVNKTTNETC